MSEFYADKIAKLCIDFYDNSLKSKSKPSANEWTTMAAILIADNSLKDDDKNKYKIISMATGSKCLAEKQLPINGTLTHDSHAEILARRCFLRYVYNEINEILENNLYDSYLLQQDDSNDRRRFSLKSNLDVVLFTSHTPCGDASIIPKINLKRELEDSSEDPVKKIKTDKPEPIEDIHRTGAKCVPTSKIQDPKERGVEYHAVGAVRTKPGRGDPTISMSCSDKIAKWCVLGIQGSLLSVFLKRPIYLKTIVVAKCQFSLESAERAFVNRSHNIDNLPGSFSKTKPNIIQSSIIFKDSKLAKNPDSVDTDDNDTDSLKACPNSVCITNYIKTKPIFVLVKGNLQGSGKNPGKKLSSMAPICKYYFLHSFTSILKKLEPQKTDLNLTYRQSKQLSEDYNKALVEFYRVYSDWIRTDQDKYYSFSL